MKNIALVLVLSIFSKFCFANMITVEFDVAINNKTNSSYGMEPFTPFAHQTVVMTFESTLSSVNRYWDTNQYPINTHVTSNFGTSGSTSISSPVEVLTGTNPIRNAPVVTTTRMVSQTWYSLLPNQIGEPQKVSYAHTIGGNMSYYSSYSPGGPGTYAGESWNRNVSIFSPVVYLGALSETDIQNYNFTSSDLIAQILLMEKNGTEFDFVDQFFYENRPTLLSSGFAYHGTAVITKISGLATEEIPEPASWLLVGIGGLLCWRFHRSKSPPPHIR